MEAIDLTHKLAQFSDQWAPKIIAQLNDYHIKLAKVEGEFVWHSHPETDEVFFVLDGTLVIQMRDHDVELKPGQMLVVPKGVEHNPLAEEECHIMLIEPAGTVNTGDAGGERTSEAEQWI
jgi:mannose-6-phosphate isomerase-like protein (cupin superfamily)